MCYWIIGVQWSNAMKLPVVWLPHYHCMSAHVLSSSIVNQSLRVLCVASSYKLRFPPFKVCTCQRQWLSLTPSTFLAEPLPPSNEEPVALLLALEGDAHIIRQRQL